MHKPAPPASCAAGKTACPAAAATRAAGSATGDARSPSIPSQYFGRHAWIARCGRCQRELTADLFRASGREGAGQHCDCGQYPFPHRRGSLFCRQGLAGMAGWHYYDRGTEIFLEWRSAWIAHQLNPAQLLQPEESCA